jgi:hypothetical protein
MIIGWATVLGGLVIFIMALLMVLAGAGLLAGAGSFEVGVVWFLGGLKYLFSGAFLVVTGMGLVTSKFWARYFMFLVAIIIFIIFKAAILSSVLYKICFVNLILAILYLFETELRDLFGINRKVGGKSA